MSDNNNRSNGWGIALSVLMIVAGLLAIAVPPAAGIAVTLFVSWLFIFGGIAHLGFAWHRRRFGSIAWEILMGLLYVAAGLYLLWQPLLGLAGLTLALVICFLLEACLEFAMAFYVRSSWLLVDAIVTLILATVIAANWPASSRWAVGVLIGISMIFSGIARLMISTGSTALSQPAINSH